MYVCVLVSHEVSPFAVFDWSVQSGDWSIQKASLLKALGLLVACYPVYPTFKIKLS